MNIIKILFCKHYKRILKPNYSFSGRKAADLYCADCDKCLGEGTIIELIELKN